MPINYALYENNLTTDPRDYMARVSTTATAEIGDVTQRMVDRGSTVVKADILSVLEDYYSAIEIMVLEGQAVNTPLAHFKTTVKGVFDGPTDAFDPQRHQIEGIVSPGKRFRAAVRDKARVEKTEAGRPSPMLLEFIDLNTGEKNGVLTSGGLGHISGHRLKFEMADAAQGVFFIAADGTESRVAVMAMNKPGQLIFSTPTLTAGEYTLAVRAVFNADTLRTGLLPGVLTVS